MRLRLAPATESFLSTYAASLPHAVLLTGPTGVGLGTLARHMAQTNGTILSIVRPETKSTAVSSIPVEAIRQLYGDTKTRLSGDSFVIIDDADSMNTTAQNALLKLLEEPNESIRFILTSHTPDKLLATIRSRTQKFSVPGISAIESRRLLKANGVDDTETERRLLYVAEGLPAELARLTGESGNFTELLERVKLARGLVAGSPYQRAVAALNIPTDRQQALSILEMAMLLVRKSLAQNPDARMLTTINNLMDATTAIRSNGNVRLHLIRAMLQ